MTIFVISETERQRQRDVDREKKTERQAQGQRDEDSETETNRVDRHPMTVRQSNDYMCMRNCIAK